MEQSRALIVDPRGERTHIELEYIHKLGFLTDIAKNEQGALEKTADNHYKFIWLDVDEDPNNNYSGLDLVYKIRHSSWKNAGTPIHGFTCDKNCPCINNPKEFGSEICTHWVDVRYFDKIIALANNEEITIYKELSGYLIGHCWLNESRALRTFCNNKSCLKEVLRSMAFDQIPEAKNQLHHYYIEQHWVCMFDFIDDFKHRLRYLELRNLSDACDIFSTHRNRHDAQNLEGLYQFLLDFMDKTVFYLKSWVEKN